jgi:hypothetical protein
MTLAGLVLPLKWAQLTQDENLSPAFLSFGLRTDMSQLQGVIIFGGGVKYKVCFTMAGNYLLND